MAELQVIATAQQGILQFNKEDLKKAVEQELVKYEIEVTGDNMSEAEKARATLNKVSKALDDKRKEIKKQYCEPLDVFEKDVKEIKALVDEGSQKITVQLNSFEERRKQEKQLDITEYFSSLDFNLVPLSRLFDDKWLNKTCNDWKEQLDTKIDHINQELDIINSFGLTDEEKLEIKGYYLDCLDLTTARNQFDVQKERREALKKQQSAVEEQKQEEIVQAPYEHMEQQTQEMEQVIEKSKKQRIKVEFIATRQFYDEMNVLIKKYRPQVKILEREDIE